MDITVQQDVLAPAPVRDIELTATLPSEMVASQQQLIAWCDNRIAFCRAESQELGEAVEHAKKNKWKSGTLQTQHNRSLRRVEYYEKIKGALEQGYYIVPNFPIQIFAIRKGHNRKPKGFNRASWRNASNHVQEEQELPSGEGVYRNPFPIVCQEEKQKQDGTKYYESYPEEWDKFEFPINMAKPQIMSVTQTALAMKVFDRVGVMPSVRRKKEDPVIIGQIVHKNGPTEKVVSFMIAWHLNTNVL